jgi:hypothetical protein
MISQSNYIPWKGYFDNIAQVDEFVLYDEAQYTKRDWRNRNQIKTPQGLLWLTIPVKVKGKFLQKINKTFISDTDWCRKHLATLKQSYSKAKCFKEVFPFVEEWYTQAEKLETISEINFHFITHICDFLNINTTISFSKDFEIVSDDKTERLIDICKQANATSYYSGPAAKMYLEEDLFKNNNIDVHYYEYSGYTEYTQINGSFEHGVSILDLIFNEGTNAVQYLKN